MVVPSFCVIRQHYLGNYCEMPVNHYSICATNIRFRRFSKMLFARDLLESFVNYRHKKSYDIGPSSAFLSLIVPKLKLRKQKVLWHGAQNWWQYYKTFFSSSLTERRNKLENSSLTSFFQAVLLCAIKVRSSMGRLLELLV